MAAADPAAADSNADAADRLSDDDQRAREAARLSLREYFGQMWPIIEPRFPLVGGWYLDAMAEHAQAFILRQIHNIVVTIPPRMAKSSIWSIAMPTWAWTRRPVLRFLVGSYPGGPNIEHAVKARTVIDSLWYQRNFGDAIRLRDDQNEKDHYENTAGGYRITTHVGGGTGKGGDFTVLDDPHNIEERHNREQLKKVISWHDTVWFGRLDDLIQGGRAVIQQRVATDDLAGHLLAGGDYVHLNLPQEYSKKRMVTIEGGERITPKATPLGWVDPRTVEGELLCPGRMGPPEVDAARRLLRGEFDAQQNQDPTPEKGSLFLREWFVQFVDAAPPEGSRCRGWDAAATEDAGDYTAGVKLCWARDGKIYVEHVHRGQWGPANADKEMLNQAKVDGRSCHQFEEQEPGSSGKRVVAAHRLLLKGFSYSAESSGVDKAARARPFRSECEGMNVYIVRGPWNQAWIDELVNFRPNGSGKDDQVDGSSGSYNWLVVNHAADDLVVG